MYGGGQERGSDGKRRYIPRDGHDFRCNDECVYECTHGDTSFCYLVSDQPSSIFVEYCLECIEAGWTRKCRLKNG